MEINLNWVSEDNFLINKNDNNQIIKLVSSLNFINNLSHSREGTIFQISHNPNSKFPLYIVSPTQKAIKEINYLLKQGEEKEKKLAKLNKDLDNLKKKTFIDKEKLSRLFLKVIKEKDRLYLAIQDKIIDNILKDNSFINEIKEVQGNIIKMKTSKIFALYYKIFLLQGEKGIEYMYKFGSIFKSNYHNISILTNTFILFLRTIILNLNEEIEKKLKNNTIFLKNKQDYQQYMKYIESHIEILPIIKWTTTFSHSVIFSDFDEPIHAKQSENEFLIIKEIIQQYPSFEKLKENIAEDKVVIEALIMVFNRDFELHKNKNFISKHLLYDNLLYDN